jgi:hypothetical protein
MERLLGTDGVHVGFPTHDCGFAQKQTEIPAIGLGKLFSTMGRVRSSFGPTNSTSAVAIINST